MARRDTTTIRVLLLSALAVRAFQPRPVRRVVVSRTVGGMAPKKKASGEAGAAPKAKAAKKSAEAIARSAVERRVAAAGARTLKVVSINVAGLRSVLDEDKPPAKRDALAALVAAEAPDVLCLNEHKLKEEDVEAARAKLAALLPAYGRSEFACSGPPGKKGYSGVAMLFRDGGAVPGEARVVAGMPGVAAAADDDIVNHEGRLLTLELPYLTLVATYVPNSGQDLKRLDYRTGADAGWDRSLGAYVASLKEGGKRAVAVVGDLNVCAGPRDIHNMYARPNFDDLAGGSIPVEDQYAGLSAIKKQAGLTIEERTSFARLLDDAGLVDAFRAQHPDASGVFSYYSQRAVANRPANRGLRLDYVLATPDLLANGAKPCALLDAAVLSDADVPALADHTPVVATFVLDN